MQVRGSRALVTGGASGLGEGTVRRFSAGGAKVAILDLPQSEGAKLAEELGGDATFVAADVTDAEAVRKAVGDAAAAMGGIDVCVTAAGVAPAHRVVARSGDLFPLELFRFVVDVNLIGLFDVVRNVAAIMGENEPTEDGERGLIVTVASIAAFEGQIGQAAYSASKGAVAAMTLPLARDLASRGIRVLCIAPGIMDTPMLAAGGPELKERLADVHLFPKRLGTADDFAGLVEHMVGNSLLNGTVVRLDAGSRMAPR
jgi:3-hydroxyacyl-CoA dehydrogenase/3-hydroxy-2-methylbutyryl-CoA dehydrogenase